MGLSCAHDGEKVLSLVTLSLNLEFVSVARKGDWLEFDTHFVKRGRSVHSAQGRATSNGKVCGLFSATFKVVSSAA